ncbi:MAG: 23S rRNA (uracil(1939)-C(5))-methyltransferase RlmD [Syntrophales bacterium]|nr:23S rRNA (uracil(1939)-C(5))-methyltransferase RlmD [Syntrophales bacterium]
MDQSVCAGDIIEVSIGTIAFGGSGVGRVGPMVVFVPFTAVGDVVEAKIVKVKKNYLTGEIVKILSASPDRADPVCPYFSLCGGCQYQHLSYEVQLRTKERQVTESFERIGKIADPPVETIIPSPLPLGYRGKAEFHGIPAPGGGFHLGFMDTEGGGLVDIGRCDIVDESINTEYVRLRERIASGKIPSHRTRYILWSGVSYPSESYITRTVGEKNLVVSSSGFFQGNASLVETLTQHVVEMCDLKESDRVLDACCGCGLFSLFIAPRVREVFGIEINGAAVSCATRNAKNHGITNARFQRGDMEGILNRLAREDAQVDTVLLDPPRVGCTEKTLSAIDRLQPERIVYVSCNPATQARDVRRLTDKGFRLETLQPIDMFPQTQHIEVIAALAR